MFHAELSYEQRPIKSKPTTKITIDCAYCTESATYPSRRQSSTWFGSRYLPVTPKMLWIHYLAGLFRIAICHFWANITHELLAIYAAFRSVATERWSLRFTCRTVTCNRNVFAMIAVLRCPAVMFARGKWRLVALTFDIIHPDLSSSWSVLVAKGHSGPSNIDIVIADQNRHGPTRFITNCAARWPPQYATTPWPWLLTFWPWSRSGSRVWPGVPLCKVSSS